MSVNLQNERKKMIECRAIAISKISKRMNIQKSSVFLKCDKNYFRNLTQKIWEERFRIQQ